MTTNLSGVDVKPLVIDAVIKNVEKIDWGEGMNLTYHAEDVPLGPGYADLLLIDHGNSVLYVVEIIAIEAGAGDIGQLLGLCGWLKGMLLPASAMDQPNNRPLDVPTPFVIPSVAEIKGIILAQTFNAGAICAVSLCPGITAKRYNFSIQLGDL